MNGRRAAVRTLSSIRSSSNFIVDACSMIDSGVVSTIFKEVDVGGEISGVGVLVAEVRRCVRRLLNSLFRHWFLLKFRLFEILVFA